MLVYLADTVSREQLGYHQIMPIRNHLESYWRMKNKKNNIDTWFIAKGDNNEIKQIEVN